MMIALRCFLLILLWEIVGAGEAFADPIARMEPESMFLGGGRIAAFANPAGRPAATLVPAWNEEAHLALLFDRNVLHRKEAP